MNDSSFIMILLFILTLYILTGIHINEAKDEILMSIKAQTKIQVYSDSVTSEFLESIKLANENRRGM